MMNRRGLLKALGIGAATIPTIGPKQAASLVGLDTTMGASLLGSVEECARVTGGISSSSYWESPLRLALEAQQFSRHEGNQRYQHMKSWSASYRRMADARDYAAMQILHQRLQNDESLRDKLAHALFGRLAS